MKKINYISVIIVLIVGIIVFLMFFLSSSMSSKNMFEECKLSYVSHTYLGVGVDFISKKKMEVIKEGEERECLLRDEISIRNENQEKVVSSITYRIPMSIIKEFANGKIDVINQGDIAVLIKEDTNGLFYGQEYEPYKENYECNVLNKDGTKSYYYIFNKIIYSVDSEYVYTHFGTYERSLSKDGWLLLLNDGNPKYYTLIEWTKWGRHPINMYDDAKGIGKITCDKPKWFPQPLPQPFINFISNNQNLFSSYYIAQN